MDKTSSFGLRLQPCKCKNPISSKELSYSFYVGVVPLQTYTQNEPHSATENLLSGQYLFGSGNARFLTVKVKPSREAVGNEVMNEISQISYNKNGATCCVFPDTEIRMMYQHGNLTGAGLQRSPGQILFSVDKQPFFSVASPPVDQSYRPFLLLTRNVSKLHLPSLHLSKKRRAADYMWSVNKRLWRTREFADASVVCRDGTVFPVHRTQMCVASPVFRAYFQHGYSLFSILLSAVSILSFNV